jgi:hypothetical protein
VWLWGPPQPLINGYRKALFSGEKPAEAHPTTGKV